MPPSRAAAFAAPSNTKSLHDLKHFLTAIAANAAKAMGPHSPAMAACCAAICSLLTVPIALSRSRLLSQSCVSFAASAVRRCSGQQAKVNTLAGSRSPWAPWIQHSPLINKSTFRSHPRPRGMKSRIIGRNTSDSSGSISACHEGLKTARQLEAAGTLMEKLSAYRELSD